MTEVTPHPLKTQGFHYYFILLFYDHPAIGGAFLFAFFPFSADFFSLLSDDAVKILADDLESVIGLFPVSIM